jgi:hypothetical protein
MFRVAESQARPFRAVWAVMQQLELCRSGQRLVGRVLRPGRQSEQNQYMEVEDRSSLITDFCLKESLS